VVAGFTGRRITADIRSGGSAESISGAGMRTSGDFGDEAAIADLGPVLQFMRLLWGVDHALQRASKHMARSLGVTGPQRLVIRIIGRSPGISAGLLARILHVHPSTLTGVIERLERHALLRRRHDPTDGRRVPLTDAKGSKLRRCGERHHRSRRSTSISESTGYQCRDRSSVHG